MTDLATENQKINILQTADNLVNGDRQEDYGHPIEDFSRTAKLWSAVKGVEFTAEDVAMFMICVKISRQVNKPKEDNLVDLAGYAQTLQMVLDKRKENNT